MSNYIGVRFDNRRGKFRADIRHAGTRKFLGYYVREIDAAEAYNKYVTANQLQRPTNILVNPKQTVAITSGNLQILAPTQSLRQALGLNKSTVVVNHSNLLTLEEAVVQALEQKRVEGGSFSIYDITTVIRGDSNEGNICITDVEFVFDDGYEMWLQSIPHERVKEIALSKLANLSVRTTDTGKWLEYSF